MKHPNVAPMYGYTEQSELFGSFGALISPVGLMTSEFYSQLIFLKWHKYGDSDQFLQQYGALLSIEERRKLASILRIEDK